jgi:hypothetical protein
MKVSQYGLQDSFQRARNAIMTAYINSGMSAGDAEKEVQNAVLAQSYLRLEQPIVASQNTLVFPILTNQGGGSNATPRPTEVRLNQQDSFFASSLQVYLAKAISATDSTFELQTYPNPVTFPLGGLVATGSAPLYTFYNGFLQVVVNKSVIIPNYPLSNFCQIPQTQLTAAANSPETQFDPGESVLLEPNINFVGTKSNNLQVIMPAGILTGVLDTFTYVVMVIQGILAQNVTLMS